MESRKWGYCLIGGLAVLRWGEPRLTVGVDVTLLAGYGSEPEYIDPLIERFDPRIDHMRDFAIQNRVLLLRSKDGFPIDIALGGLPFEESAVRRSSLFEYADRLSLRTCSAEDLVVMKAFANRDSDWADVRGILIRNGDTLEWNYIWEQLQPLCAAKENPGILDKLRTLKDRD